MLARLAGIVTIVAVLVVGLLAGGALAVEEEEGRPGHGGPLPALEELGSQSEVSQRFFPEPAEEPVFTPFLVYPLLGVGLLAALIILTLYLRWQPEFEEERQKASARRRR
jgi:hypothetical protein